MKQNNFLLLLKLIYLFYYPKMLNKKREETNKFEMEQIKKKLPFVLMPFFTLIKNHLEFQNFFYLKMEKKTVKNMYLTKMT